MGNLEISEGKKKNWPNLNACRRSNNWDELKFIPNGTGAVMGARSFRPPETWSQWRPLCNTNMLCQFRNLWCHPHPYGMHANNMQWDIIFSPLGFMLCNSLACAFQHHHFVLSFLVLLECLWSSNYSSITCHCEFHGEATSLPWFCAFSWITRLTKEFQFCC